MRNKRFKITLMIISTFILCYHIFKLFYLWSEIPFQIAIHFSSETPDNWGPKYILFIIPIVSILSWLLIGLLVKNPERLNYVNLTEANKKIQFTRAERVMLLIQNLSFISFILANEALLKNAVGMESSLPFSIAIVLLVICFIAPVYLLIWASTLKY
ncbi:DUF1648 domain-containing protein [Mesobacillus maritimus]|uniref:DUF1648 domain-containing protein n=1 Tax=Mesobacillus maritimus TaxID=1643336 RepID=UPI00203BEF85|nr:DUF1648 domain-containing protein [Mesobacillus maritimus]